MATARPCLAQLSRICLSSSRPTSVPSARLFSTTVTLASKKDKPVGKPVPSKYKKKKGEESGKKKKPRTAYRQYDMRDAEMFTLCDAMRYVSCSFSPPKILTFADTSAHSKLDKNPRQ